MANLTSYFDDTFRRDNPDRLDGTLPIVSRGLDSHRIYNFEVHFNRVPIFRLAGELPPTVPGPQPAGVTDRGRVEALALRGEPLATSQQWFTLAANKVTSAGHKVADIGVRRLNDLLYYPGAAESDLLTITFDHLLEGQPMHDLFTYFAMAAYNPKNGIVANANVGKIGSIDIVHLDNARTPRAITTYYGAYPASFKPGESNYSTNNQFHTFEVTFRYDFMNYEARILTRG